MYIGAGRDVQSRLGVTVLVGNGVGQSLWVNSTFWCVNWVLARKWWVLVLVNAILLIPHSVRDSGLTERARSVSWPDVSLQCDTTRLYPPSKPRFLLSVFFFNSDIEMCSIILFSFSCSVSCVLWLGCQYQFKWLTEKSRLLNPL